MAANTEHEFLSLAPPNLASDDESTSSPLSSIRPHLDTLFAEFSRTRPRLSLSPPARIRRTISSSNLQRIAYPTESSRSVDLRNLEYVSEYDSHLMCPICHVPFINPIVLECDHTFCDSCYEQYRSGTPLVQQDQCPTCRTELDEGVKKASRLISNMCNDLKVRCPNEYCDQVLPRGCIEQHVSKECPEQKLECPDSSCSRLIKRKNFVADRCLHTSHVECDCGELIELGRGEWLPHKDGECPKTWTRCEKCGERILRTQSPTSGPHVCRERMQKCPGADFGCDERFEPTELDAHSAHCPMARMAPYLQKQARLLSSLQEQLTQAQVRNDVLETGLDKIRDIVRNQHHPPDDDTGSISSTSSLEEIERSPPLPHSRHHRHHTHRHDAHNDDSTLTLPAHLRALTPSPDPSSTATQQQQQHLLALQESLRLTVSSLETDLGNLHNALADLDARSSMQIMNETLRIKEDLAHTNAALFSTRAQVQWLLNRERVVSQQQSGRGSAGGGGGSTALDRGRSTVTASSSVVASTTAAVNDADVTAGPSNAAAAAAAPYVPLPSSTTTSPRLMGVRRPSGGNGSQERVKL